MRLDREYVSGSRSLNGSGVAVFERHAPSDARIWFTEVGSRVDTADNNGVRRNTEDSQADEVRFLVDTLSRQSTRIDRLYYYHWCEPNAGKALSIFDSGLINPGEPCAMQTQRESYRAYKARTNRNPDG